MNLEVSEQGRIEKQLAKGKGLRELGRKISGFFIKPKLEELLKKRPHTATTSLPELETIIQVLKKKLFEMALGNLLGSCITNINSYPRNFFTNFIL